ncbi:hypothetical protein QBC44DRAFT_383445 [Cladorrhinum sp. PSN332]|nr:hypothetical protein QBC44DRAFT_383445 [Cladorrhinum sp. PSN332]
MHLQSTLVAFLALSVGAVFALPAPNPVPEPQACRNMKSCIKMARGPLPEPIPEPAPDPVVSPYGRLPDPKA